MEQLGRWLSSYLSGMRSWVHQIPGLMLCACYLSDGKIGGRDSRSLDTCESAGVTYTVRFQPMRTPQAVSNKRWREPGNSEAQTSTCMPCTTTHASPLLRTHKQYWMKWCLRYVELLGPLVWVSFRVICAVIPSKPVCLYLCVRKKKASLLERQLRNRCCLRTDTVRFRVTWCVVDALVWTTCFPFWAHRALCLYHTIRLVSEFWAFCLCSPHS